MTDDAARGEISAADFQTDAEHRLPVFATARRCEATTASGAPCRAHPLAGSTLCSLHTPGLASERGRRGGLNRRRTPKPTPRKPAARVAPDSPVAQLPDVEIRTADDAAALLVETMNQLRRGEIDVQVANALSRLVQQASKTIVQVELERRLNALEAGAEAKETPR